jgi:uncharacterized protein YdhG (YjbR/CyaY superfamily)
MEKRKINTVDEYIKLWPLETQKRLNKIRKVIKEIVPDAEERISYKMPMIYLNGVLIYFAAFKNHIGFFPTASGVNAFKSEITEYKNSKGTIQFPHDKQIPFELIKRILLFRAKENRKKIKLKKTKEIK